MRRKLYEAQVTVQLSIAAGSRDELVNGMLDLAEQIADLVEESEADELHRVLLADVLPGSVLLQDSELQEGFIRLAPVEVADDE